jgi:APA family basic amino acid/polyamine antiporter
LANARFERRLGVADVTLLVVGSVIGSGIFRTPAVVAGRLHSAPAILAAWATGGAIALFGAFVLGELGARRPEGGAYAYLREAFHPVVAFAYGWTAMLASFTGGLAAAAVLFAGYFVSLTGWHVSASVVAVAALVALAIVNCFGVREGSNVQNALTALKAGALVALVVAAATLHGPIDSSSVTIAPLNETAGFALAMIPVLFAYNGAVVANFMTAEAKRVVQTLPRGLWVGMLAVALLYVLVNAGCIHALGIAGLARTTVPVSDVLRMAAGSDGARLASLAIAIATLGFMSNRMLTVPRLYHAMADDGLFFRSVAWVDPRTGAPVVAIALQAVLGAIIALSGSYDHILNYVVSTFYVFNGLLALALFVLCTRDRHANTQAPQFRVPWHPVSTGIYMLASWGVALATIIAYPRDGLAGVAILLSAIPAYLLWTRSTASKARAT